MSWQTVSVFISSTFKDMHSERDILIKQAFPKLREKLLPYRIKLLDIDLRWGITEDQAENDETIDFCLESIENCRPFFLGIMGERYGWIPDKKPTKVENTFPQKVSITAMEIYHGVLNDNNDTKVTALDKLVSRFSKSANSKSNALFFFRDPEFEKAMPPELREVVESEGEEHKQKQTELKEQIKRHPNKIKPVKSYSCHYRGVTIDWFLLEEEAPELVKKHLSGKIQNGVVEAAVYSKLPDEVKKWLKINGTVYLDELEDFAQNVVDSIWDVLSHEFPRLNAPPVASADVNLLEDDEHLRFLDEITALFVGRDQILKTLSNDLKTSKTPVVIAGSTGTGKSALLGKVVNQWKSDNPNGEAIVHFSGASILENNPENLFHRLLRKLKSLGSAPDGMLMESGVVANDLYHVIEAVSSGRQLLIAIDDFDLIFADRGLDLRWIPESLNQNISVLLTLSDDQVLANHHFKQLKQIGCAFRQIPVLRKEERKLLIRQLPALSAKTMDKKHIELLSNHPSSNLPLFLAIALEELRMFGSYERLEKRIRMFPEQTGKEGLQEVYHQIIQRLEKELGSEEVVRPLSLLACSVTGLRESEIRSLCPAISPEKLALLWRELRIHLNTKEGLISFYHKALLHTIQKYYLAEDDKKKSYHTELASFFSNQPDQLRVTRELPEHYYQSDQIEKLRQYLFTLENFLFMQKRIPNQLQLWWNKAGVKQPLDLLHQMMCKQLGAYQEILNNNQGSSLSFWTPFSEEDNIVVYSNNSYNPEKALLSAQKQEALIEMVRLADQYRIQNDAAFLIRLKTLAIFEQEYGPVHTRTLEVLASALPFVVAQIQEEEIAEKYLAKIFVNATAWLSQRHLVYINIVRYYQRYKSRNNKAIEKLQSNFKELMSFFENNESNDKMQLNPADALFNEKQLIRLKSEIILEHSQVLRQEGFIDEAMQICRTAVDFSSTNLGSLNELTLQALNNLASILMENKGDFEEGEKILTETWQLANGRIGKQSEAGLVLVNNLSVMYGNTGRFEEGLPFYKEAVERKTATLGETNPSTLHSEYNLAYCYLQLGEFDKAEVHCRYALKGFEKLGDKHLNSVVTMQVHLSDILYSAGKKKEAGEVLNRAAQKFDTLEESEKDWKTYYTLTSRQIDALLRNEEMDEAKRLLWRQLEVLLPIKGATQYIESVFRELDNILIPQYQKFEKEKKYLEAFEIVQELVKLYTGLFGDEHAKTLNRKMQKADLLSIMGNYEEAETILREVVSGLEASIGREAPETRIAVSKLSSVLLKTGKEEEAGALMMGSIKAGANRKTDTETLSREIIAKTEQEYGLNHPKTLMLLDEAAAELLEENKFLPALEFMVTVFERSEEAYGPLAEETSKRASNLAGFYFRTGDNKKVEPLFRRVADSYEQLYGLSSEKTIVALEDLQNVLVRIEEYAEAIAINEKILPAKKSVYGDESPQALKSMISRLDLFEKIENEEQYQTLLIEVVEWLELLFKNDNVKRFIERYLERAKQVRHQRIEQGISQIKELQKEGKLDFIGTDRAKLEEMAESMTQDRVNHDHPEGSEEIGMLVALLQSLSPYKAVVAVWESFCNQVEENLDNNDLFWPLPRFLFSKWFLDKGLTQRGKENIIKVWKDGNIDNRLVQQAASIVFNLIAYDDSTETIQQAAIQINDTLNSGLNSDLPELQFFRNQAAAFFMQTGNYAGAIEFYTEMLNYVPGGTGGHEYFFNEVKINLGKALALSGEIEKGAALCDEAWQFFVNHEDKLPYYAHLAAAVAEVQLLNNNIQKAGELNDFVTQNTEALFNALVDQTPDYGDVLHQILNVKGVVEAAKRNEKFVVLGNAFMVLSIVQKHVGHIENMNETLWNLLNNTNHLEQGEIKNLIGFVMNMWKQTGQQKMIDKLNAILNGK